MIFSAFSVDWFVSALRAELFIWKFVAVLRNITSMNRE